MEPGRDRPIGFSKRRIWGFLDFVGPNCAFCHVSTIRRTEGGAPETILGMPANTVDIKKFFEFLFKTAAEPNFTVRNVMAEIKKTNPNMGFLQKLAYPIVILVYRSTVLELSKKFDFLSAMPEFGPGRVETWTPYKQTIVDPALPVSVPGIADYAAIWNQRPRIGQRLHWDGNNHVLEERNLIAALGVVGEDFEALDLNRLRRVTAWTMAHQPPRYQDMTPANRPEFEIKQPLASRGKILYLEHCADCHDSSGKRYGQVESPDTLGTDKARVDSFTDELAAALNKIGADSWRLRNFKKTQGYVNSLLDGIWLRAPYLHNGSVPTLWHLLTPEERPEKFCRGNDVYDWLHVGFQWKSTNDPGGKEICPGGFLYDTAIQGNGNAGHTYGRNLSKNEKDALIEYLKTL
jgi:hypothetical protein